MSTLGACYIADRAYSCECRNNSAPGYPVPSIPCNNPVGRIDVVNESSGGNQIPNMNNSWERSRWGCVLALCFGSVFWLCVSDLCVFICIDIACFGSVIRVVLAVIGTTSTTQHRSSEGAGTAGSRVCVVAALILINPTARGMR